MILTVLAFMKLTRTKSINMDIKYCTSCGDEFMGEEWENVCLACDESGEIS